MAQNIARLHAWCSARGADVAVAALPRSYQHSKRECPKNWEAAEYEPLGPYALEPFKFFDELRQREQFPVWSLLEAFRDSEEFPLCFESDPHWTALGHTVAADGLAAPILELLVRRLGD